MIISSNKFHKTKIGSTNELKRHQHNFPTEIFSIHFKFSKNQTIRLSRPQKTMTFCADFMQPQNTKLPKGLLQENEQKMEHNYLFN